MRKVVSLSSFALFALLSIAACHSAQDPEKTAPTDKPAELHPNAQVHCSKDSECGGGCGPCMAGDVQTQRQQMMECVVNPCPNAVWGCVNGLCTVTKTGTPSWTRDGGAR